MASTSYAYDRERVRTDDLAVILDRWCELCGEENPVDRIAQITQVDVRTIYRIRGNNTKTTSIYLADRILTLLGYDFNQVFIDGRLRSSGPKRMIYHRTTLDCTAVRPHTRELVERCGGTPLAGAYALVDPGTLKRILSGKECTVQQATARKILLALEHRRIEDEEVKKIQDRLRLIRQNDAINQKE